jgi:hypothetical protein
VSRCGLPQVIAPNLDAQGPLFAQQPRNTGADYIWLQAALSQGVITKAEFDAVA